MVPSRWTSHTTFTCLEQSEGEGWNSYTITCRGKGAVIRLAVENAVPGKRPSNKAERARFGPSGGKAYGATRVTRQAVSKLQIGSLPDSIVSAVRN